MPRANANGIELEYETIGSERDPALVLVNGSNGQLTDWGDGLCESLAECGLRVVRFDSRDLGLSTRFEGKQAPNFLEASPAVEHDPLPPLPYTHDDLVDDLMGLLDALDIPSAHLLGMSLGGVVAQLAALRHPARTRSLVLLMSTPLDPSLPPPTREALRMLVRPEPTSREDYITRELANAWVLAGRRFPPDEKFIRRRAEEAWDRGHNPEGRARLLTAVTQAGCLVERLAALRAPTLILHGSEDPLVPPACASTLARAIRGSDLEIIDGLGHSLWPAVWPVLVHAVARHLERAENAGGARPALSAASQVTFFARSADTSSQP